MTTSPYEAIVRHADPAGVVPGLSDVVSSAPSGRLVVGSNVFCAKTPIGTPAQQAADAPAYFAGAALLHVEDGWAYLGRSFASLLQGDHAAALHLAYYAELRAAIGLLAGHGILSGNWKAWALNNQGRLIKRKLKHGTHGATWELFERWSRRTDGFDMLSEVLRPFGYPLKDWLDTAQAVGVGGSPLATAQHLLRQWSLDLKHLGADRDARNTFSYQPSGLQARGEFASEPFICEIWRDLDPQGIDPFEQLDRYLLRDTLDIGMRSLTPATRRSAALDALLKYMGEPPGAREVITRSSAFAHDPAVIKFSRGPAVPWAVIARATILLRVATGSGRWLLAQAGATGEDLRAWGERIVSERQLDPSGGPAEFVDLWLDIDESLAHLATLPALAGERTQAMLRRLEGCERVTAWSLAA